MPAQRPTQGDDFSSLLGRAQRGDRDAAGALCDRYWGRVAAAVRSRLPDVLRRRYDTMDFAQSVFAEVIRDLPRLEDRGEGAFIRLLQIKAENKVRRRLKSHLGPDGRRAEKRLATGDDVQARGGDALAALGSLDDDVKLHRLLANLDAKAREILRLRAEDRSFAQIAKAVGLASAEAARKRHARAVLALRRQWDAPAS